jgi:nitrogen fixation/metabolism regulation signal transduction histidine kinase
MNPRDRRSDDSILVRAREELVATVHQVLSQEQRLHDLDATLSALLGEVDRVVFALGDGYLVEAVSRGANELAGVPPERLIGRSLREVGCHEALAAVATAARRGLDAMGRDGSAEVVQGGWNVRVIRCRPPAHAWLVVAQTTS